METIPEIKGLVQLGHLYLHGRISVDRLAVVAERCREHCMEIGAHPGIILWAEEWVEMTSRRWNPRGDRQDPLTEGEFRWWLEDVLRTDFEESPLPVH